MTPKARPAAIRLYSLVVAPDSSVSPMRYLAALEASCTLFSRRISSGSERYTEGLVSAIKAAVGTDTCADNKTNTIGSFAWRHPAPNQSEMHATPVFVVGVKSRPHDSPLEWRGARDPEGLCQ
jgi:hypothetical protein